MSAQDDASGSNVSEQDRKSGNKVHEPIIGEKASGRRMIYPYTYTAKIVQFPLRWHMKHSWVAGYYIYGVLASIPLFLYIGHLSKSKENKAKWAEIRRKEREERHYRHHGAKKLTENDI